VVALAGLAQQVAGRDLAAVETNVCHP